MVTDAVIKAFEDDLSVTPLEYEAGRAGYMWAVNILFRYLYRPGPFQVDMPSLLEMKDNNFKLYFSFTPQEVKKSLNYFLNDGGKGVEDEISMRSEAAIARMQDCDVHNREALADAFADYFVIVQHLHHCAVYLRKVDRGIIAAVNKEFGSLASDILSHCNVSERPGFFVQESLTLARAACESGSEDIRTLAEDVYAHFSHITLGYYNEQARSLEYYIEKLQVLRELDAQSELEKNTAEHTERLRERDEFIQKYPAHEKLIMAIGESAWLKDYYKFSANRAQAVAEIMWQQAAFHTSLPAKYLKTLMHDDLDTVLRGRPLDRERVSAYNAHSIFIIKTESYSAHYTGSEAAELERHFLHVEAENSTEFKGRPACKGKAQGKVVVVLSPDDFAKVNSGDIIVVQNTSPDFVPVLSKVAAIVAEEGGITAHVSVISREMKVPAVVGISGVTKRLKDGDNVVVDATAGIVTVLRT